MGIIGVVAALTLPNLNSSTGDKEKVAKVKKIYSNLEDAYGRVEAVYGPVDEWANEFYGNSGVFVNRMTDFIKVTKYLDYRSLPSGAFANHNTGNDNTMFILSDGTAICFFSNASSGSQNSIAYVDIDGLNKGQSKLGYDIFEFIIYDNQTSTNRITPAGLDSTDQKLTDDCFKTGKNCTAWIVQTGNMDYLKATNGKCTNNVQLSWSNTGCK